MHELAIADCQSRLSGCIGDRSPEDGGYFVDTSVRELIIQFCVVDLRKHMVSAQLLLRLRLRVLADTRIEKK